MVPILPCIVVYKVSPIHITLHPFRAKDGVSFMFLHLGCQPYQVKKPNPTQPTTTNKKTAQKTLVQTQ